MLEAIEKKEAAKKSRDSSSGEIGQKPTAQPENKLPKIDRRLTAFKGHIQKLRDRIKKDIKKIKDAHFRESIEKEIRALLDEVSAYQKGKSEEE